MNKKIKEYEKRFPSVSKLSIVEANECNKRFKATFTMKNKQYTVRFGQIGAFTYFDGAPKEKMLSYRARASKITNKKNEYTYKKAGTANSLAYWILW